MDKVTLALICAFFAGCTAVDDEVRDVERSTKVTEIERVGITRVYRVDDSERGVTCYFMPSAGISCVTNRWSGNP